MKEGAPPSITQTVFVVDDDAGIREALQSVLETVGFATAAYASAREFLEAYHPSQAGCLLLDIRMPGMSGLELQKQLNARGAVIPVIFVSGHGDISMAVEAMKHGAFDFLEKPFREEDLLDRVRRALARDARVRKALSEHARIRERLESLTPRERDVLNRIVEGKSNKVIGGELRISTRTVELHRAHVMEKMQASSLAELVRMMIDAEGQARPGKRSG
ncbi:MAG TPA: response regulator transcription factor [Steroidobacteraceae bacterium]